MGDESELWHHRRGPKELVSESEAANLSMSNLPSDYQDILKMFEFCDD